MKKILTLILIGIATFAFGQTDTTQTSNEWPYNMPILGKKAVEKGHKIQLPYGLNVNYVYNRMDLEISEFGMTIGDDPNSTVNQLINEYLTLEALNFQRTIAKTNGLNLRADLWVLPFWNLYGLYSNNTGSTEVSLQPEWYDDQGDLVLALPQITSIVNFNANTFGVGSTVAGKIYGSYFFSVDGNISWSSSEILDEPANVTVLSARIGDRFSLKRDVMLSLYVGAMYRGFLGNKGNFGSIAMNEALPEIGSNVFAAIDERVNLNNEKIAALDPNNPLDQRQIEALESKNETLFEIDSVFTEVISQDVNYGIKKELVNSWSVQFGFNLEVNEHLMLRGEFGKGNGNDFVMMGVQYRFGMKRK